MNMVYSVMWLLIAVILFSMGIKEHKIYMVFSVYFLFNSIWWGISFFTENDMFHGGFGWTFRGVTVIFLIIGIIYYSCFMNKSNNKTDK